MLKRVNEGLGHIDAGIKAGATTIGSLGDEAGMIVRTLNEHGHHEITIESDLSELGNHFDIGDFALEVLEFALKAVIQGFITKQAGRL